jgi:hypothetical protein
MTEALAQRVARALQELPADQREALELRERDGASYAIIGEQLERTVDGAAVLLVAARMALRQRVLGSPAVPTSGDYCVQARAWLAAMEDSEHLEVEEIQWTRAHVRECETCPSARRALREACLASRAWAAAGAPEPAVPEDDDDDDEDFDGVEEELEEVEDERQPGMELEGPGGSATAMVRHRRPSAFTLLRRRLSLAAGAGATVLVLGLLIFGGGGDATPGGRTASTPSDGGIVPPPGEQFCADGEPDC